MTAFARVSRTGYYSPNVEAFGQECGPSNNLSYLATERNLMDNVAGFTIGTATPTATGTASLRGRVAVHGLAQSSVKADKVNGLLELMFDMKYPADASAYSIFQMDMTGTSGLTHSALGGQTLDYPGAARVIRSDGTVAARAYFAHTPGSTSKISSRVWRHSSPSQYVLGIGRDSDGLSSTPTAFVPLVNSGESKYGYGLGIRSAAATTIRQFNCNKLLSTTTACPTYNCYSGNLAPLMYLTITGTTRALGLEPGTVQDGWPGDGDYYLWQTSQTTWVWIGSPGSNPFGGSPGRINLSIFPNGSNWDIQISPQGALVARFEKINFAGGQNGQGGTLTTSQTTYQNTTDGGGSCVIGTGT